MSILKIIYSQYDGSGVGSNYICSQTGFGKNKQPIYKLLKELKRGKLINVNSTKKRGRKEPIHLSQLGKEIVNFIEDIQSYSRSCLAFRKRFLHLFDYIDESTNDLTKITAISQLNITRSESFKLYQNFMAFYYFIEHMARPNIVIDRIILRYCLFVARSDLIGNAFAKELLTQMIIKAIDQELLYLTENSTELYFNKTLQKKFRIEEIFDNATQSAQDYISNICRDTDILEIPYLSKEFLNMAKMTFRILVPGTILPGLVKEYENISREAEKSKDQETKRYGKRFQAIADLYREGYSKR